MKTYWLCRAPGAVTEGPFGLSQLRAMYAAGAVTQESKLCLMGDDFWMTAELVLKVMPGAEPVENFARSMRRRDEEMAQNYSRAINWITGAIGLLACVPLLGVVAYILAGVWVILGTILCVMQMVKGAIFEGIMNLVAIWIFMPSFIIGIQMLYVFLAANK